VTTAIIKYFKRDESLVVVRVAGTALDVALRVCGTDRSTAAKLVPGETVSFDIARDRRGCAVAIDVSSIQPRNVGGG
jgi:hypothetical protein